MAPPVIFIAGKDPLSELGGHSNFVRAHARAAQRAGFEPHLFCVAPHSGTMLTDFGVLHRTASPFRLVSQMMVPAHAPLLSAAVARFLQDRNGPHLVHGFNLWGYVGISVSHRLRRQRCQVVPVVSAYTTMQHELIGKLKGSRKAHGRQQRLRRQVELAWCRLALNRYERRTLTESRLVLVNYDSVRRLFANKHGAGAEVRRVAYASEAAFLRADAKDTPAAPPIITALQPAAAPLIVAVSRHDPRKGLDVLLRALAELRAQGVPFRACLVGGGYLLAAHRRLAEQLRLGAEVAITGGVPDSFPYLQHADVFVLPSLQEGSGSVAMLEAMQAGAAIVASNLDGIPEDVTDGDSALLVEPGNVTALSQALRRAVTDTWLRAQLRRRARATFAAQFSATALTEALRQTYAELGFAGTATI